MNNLKTFFNIPLVKFTVHLVIIVGIGLNCVELYRVWLLSTHLQEQENELIALVQENNDARNQKDYFASNLYKEKYIKEQNFKKKGEQVVDTSTIETSEGQDVTNNYIPEISRPSDTNPEKWLSLIMGLSRRS